MWGTTSCFPEISRTSPAIHSGVDLKSQLNHGVDPAEAGNRLKERVAKIFFKEVSNENQRYFHYLNTALGFASLGPGIR